MLTVSPPERQRTLDGDAKPVRACDGVASLE
jgi:hypothetical protein